MQDPAVKAQLAEQEDQPLRCPRCDSTNTKFCYYNNYNLSQPRHYCKSCRRYWTKGGALRNIPVGGGSRKNSKRSSSAETAAAGTYSSKRATTASSSPTPTPPPSSPPLPPHPIAKPEPISFLYPLHAEPDRQMLDITGSFSSLLGSNGQFGNLLDGFHSGGIGVPGLPNSSDFNLSVGTSPAAAAADFQSSTDSSGNENAVPPLPENFLGLQGDSAGCWSGGWPDLAIYTPGSSFP